MAERRNTRRPQRQTRRRKKTAPRLDLGKLFSRTAPDFRPDNLGTPFVKLLHITRQQGERILRWTLYVVVIVAALVIQDAVMSRVHLFGATTDLPVSAMILIALLEGSETGSVMILVSSVLYSFSGSAPDPACIGIMTAATMFLALFRQKYWHRSGGSIVLCSAVAMMVYELGIFAVALFRGLTRFARLEQFILTGLYGGVTMILLYPMLNKISLIGGSPWKE